MAIGLAVAVRVRRCVCTARCRTVGCVLLVVGGRGGWGAQGTVRMSCVVCRVVARGVGAGAYACSTAAHTQYEYLEYQ